MNSNNSKKIISVDLTKADLTEYSSIRSPLLSSNKLGWKNLNFNYFKYGKCETGLHTLEHRTIGLILDRGKVERKLAGKYKLENAVVGSSVIIPSQVEHWSAWQIEGRFAMLSIQPRAIAKIDPNIINPDIVELMPTFAKSQPDPLIYGIGLAIEQHLAANIAANVEGEGLYIEHLSNAIAAHLLQHYCTRKIELKTYSKGLERNKLDRAIEYIQSNLAEKIELKDIAKELDISQYYFSHLFRNSTGISPYQYIIQQRVAKVKRMLRDSQMPLTDIALACGFSSQSQMTLHFRKLNNMTPRKYRRNLS